MSKGRNSNIEILRIISMIMIVANHYVIHGIKQWGTASQYLQYALHTNGIKVFWSFLEPGGEVGVAIFFIIAGFFASTKTKLPYKVIISTVFYSAMSFVLFGILTFTVNRQYSILSVGDYLYTVLKTILNPVSSGIYWFITVYCIIYILSPMIKRFTDSIGTKGLFILLCFSWAFLYFFQEMSEGTFYTIYKGLLFFSIGIFLSRIKKTTSRFWALALFVFSWLLNSFAIFWITEVEFVACVDDTKIKLIARLLSSISTGVFVPIAAVSIFVFFISFEPFNNKFINFVGDKTLGVYLLHDNALLRPYLWFCVSLVRDKVKIEPVICCVIILFIFCLGVAIESLRKLLFKNRTEDRLRTLVNKIISM